MKGSEVQNGGSEKSEVEQVVTMGVIIKDIEPFQQLFNVSGLSH